MIGDKVFPAVHALIEREGKYLFIEQTVLNTHQFWDLPGGKVDFGESPYDTLQREVQEEVGLQITIREPLGMWWFTRLNDGNQVVSTVFRCTAEAGDVRLDQNPTGEGITGFRWLTIGEYLAGGLTPSDTSLTALLENVSSRS
jgi:8-oxo-dGTP pyrophosphatase MutT (NUDIX family)